MQYSTLIGPASQTTTRSKIAVDGGGNAYITGDGAQSSYPTTPGSLEPTYTSTTPYYVTKLNNTGSALVYSSFLDFGGQDIAVDASGDAFLAGSGGPSSPSITGAYDPTYNGNGDAYVGKLNPAGNALVYGTFIGGASDLEVAQSIALDSAGSAYVTGYTRSADYPVTAGSADTSYNGNTDAFATKVDPTGSSLGYSTFIGGSGGESGDGIAVDAAGNAYVVGANQSSDFPTTPGAYDTTFNGGLDAFFTKVDDTGLGFAYSTFLGGTGFERAWGVGVDGAQNAWVAGETSGADYPVTPGGYDTTYNGGGDGFISRISTTSTWLCPPKGRDPLRRRW